MAKLWCANAGTATISTAPATPRNLVLMQTPSRLKPRLTRRPRCYTACPGRDKQAAPQITTHTTARNHWIFVIVVTVVVEP
jgi:hypothetical protein